MHSVVLLHQFMPHHFLIFFNVNVVFKFKDSSFISRFCFIIIKLALPLGKWYDFFVCCYLYKLINQCCRVLHRLLVLDYSEILLIPSCCPIHFQNHFFKLITHRRCIIKENQPLLLWKHIEDQYEQKLESKVGTLADLWKHYISSMDLHLLPRLDIVFSSTFSHQTRNFYEFLTNCDLTISVVLGVSNWETIRSIT